MPGATVPRGIRQELRLPRYRGHPLRLAFVSDLHLGPTTPRELLQRAFDEIRQASPDALLLGGDYVFLDPTPASLADLTRLVESVGARVTLAVMGNHDLWARDGLICEALEAAGATILVNTAVALPAPWGGIAVVGLDDPWTGERGSRLTLPRSEGPRIVLCHSPAGLGTASRFGFDLFLCGHTHGGQLSTPWGPLVVPHGELCRRFLAGFHWLGGGQAFVSRGLGGVEIPVRTWASPDYLIADLLAGSGS
jgi:predicted MPP superfamily phosphohydrolase